ncbi:MAG: tetratricopeptide repeat protein [Bryobacteraceae bacterium]
MAAGVMGVPVPILALCLAASWVAEERFELNGQIDPPRGRVMVALDGATSPYTARTVSDSNGRFRFRGLVAGPYTLRAFVPGLDESRQTVEVSASLADSRRRIIVTVPFAGTATSREAREAPHKVDTRQLSIPAAAIREYREAQTLLNKEDTGAAIKRLERAVELAPQFTEAWNNLGIIAYHDRRLEDAERYFRQALERDPGAYSPAVNLGGVLVTAGRFREALAYNTYAVQQQPQDALANVQLGMNYFYLGDLDLGQKYLKEAKRLDPNHFSYPQLLLAEIYTRRGDRKGAIGELEDFLRRHPDVREADKVRSDLDRLKVP